MILNRAKDYYKNDKEWLKEEARDKCTYHNMSEEEKKMLKEYQIYYHEAKKLLTFFLFIV